MVADPAMAKCRLEIALCFDGFQFHRPAEAQVETSAPGMNVLWPELH
jgi:hypothetical protein